MTVYKESHRNSYLMMRNDNLFQILCRRIIDRNWFPSSFRAGFHAERQDLYNFLEEYIPFDLSNINKNKTKHSNYKPHLKAIGYDWRRATDKWEIYNPGRYDYQIKGKSKDSLVEFCQLWIELFQLIKKKLKLHSKEL